MPFSHTIGACDMVRGSRAGSHGWHSTPYIPIFVNQLLCNLRKPLQTYIIPVVIFQVDQLAVGLISRGLTKGDRLAIWLPNTRDWILTQFAAAQIGLILVGACYLDK